MTGDRQWPGWRPGQELSAGHFLGLEDFLLARARIADDDAHGLDMFNWKSHLTIEGEGDARLLGVCRLRGVTPAGDPVILGTTETLRAALPREDTIDIWIDVNSQRDDDADGHPDDGEEMPDGAARSAALHGAPPKLALRVEIALAGKVAIQPAQAPRGLYLGRYRTAPLELVGEPFVRRLAALEPRDPQWHIWTGPLKDRIASLGRTVIDGAGNGSVLAAELLRLQFEWPDLPIPALVRRLRYIAWLTSASSGFPETDYAMLAPVTEDLTGAALPRYLAEILPERIGRPPNPSGLTRESAAPETSAALIAMLVANPIAYHAPVQAFEAWSSQLAALQASRFDEAAAEGLQARFVEAAKLPASYQRGDAWARAVILVSLASLEAAGARCPPALLEGDANGAGASAADRAASALDRLYGEEAVRARAGPIAFFFVALAARGLIEARFLPSVGARGVQAYFERLRNDSARPAGKPGASQGNRAYAYLDATLRATSQQDRAKRVEAMPWRPDAKGGNQPLRVVVAGRAGAGKSVLLRGICSPSVGDALSVPFEVKLVADNGQPLRASGTQGHAARTRTVEIIEAREVAALDAKADGGGDQLLLLALEPSALSAQGAPQDMENLASSVRALIERDSGVRVAIVFTKADEYGVVPSTHLRLVEPAHAALIPKLDQENSWNEFTHSRGSVSTSHPHSVITKPGAQGPGELAATRKWVLERTRPLWTRVAAAYPAAFLNAYFVAALPFDSRFDRTADRGFVQLLADAAPVLGR